MPLVNGSYWAMVHGSNAEQVLQDAEGCAVMPVSYTHLDVYKRQVYRYTVVP